MLEPNQESHEGYISSMHSSLIKIKGLGDQIRLHDLIKIADHNIIGEVIQIFPDHIIAQCFDDIFGLSLDDKVVDLKTPLSVELGPGLLGKIFDGIQRPLDVLYQHSKDGRLEKGVSFPPLSRTKKWHFVPLKKKNEEVNSGDIMGIVQETKLINHKIMVPPDTSGTLSFIVEEGDYTILNEIYKISSHGIEKSYNMLQNWPIRKIRPFKQRKQLYEPLITGLRVIDLLFPIAKGGTVVIPGGFGTGKTVIQQTLAKSCDADIIVYIGCGEPGNQIAELLKQFSEQKDPESGQPLLDRIVLIANTSNMPVSAREACLFLGITIAEYYRDMGYNVALLADSISRWAESLREISGLLEEMPAEEGYPSYLSSKLSNFYERAGFFELSGTNSSNGERTGSITIVGTLSPPGGDFNEPVTAISRRLVQGVWALDSNLAKSKYFPPVNWLESYSNYPEYIKNWWEKQKFDWAEMNFDWLECRIRINEILAKEKDLMHLTQLMGAENLSEEQQLVLFVSKLIREGIFMQDAYDEIDNYTDPIKLLGLTKVILYVYHISLILMEQGYLVREIKELKVINKILKIKHSIPNQELEKIGKIIAKFNENIENLKIKFEKTRKKKRIESKKKKFLNNF